MLFQVKLTNKVIAEHILLSYLPPHDKKLAMQCAVKEWMKGYTLHALNNFIELW